MDYFLFVKMCSGYVFFFFSSRRRHTRYWRDWSSDVCSSDLPFVLHEHFAYTAGHLAYRFDESEDRRMPYNNLKGYYQLATFYNTTYQIQTYGAILVAALLACLHRFVRPRLLGWLLAGTLLAGVALAIGAPKRFDLPNGMSWAVALFAPPLLALMLAPAVPAALRVLVLWFGTVFIAESFFVDTPRSHFYPMDVPIALLVALAGMSLVGWLRTQRLGWLRPVLAAGGAAPRVGGGPHPQVVFCWAGPGK